MIVPETEIPEAQMSWVTNMWAASANEVTDARSCVCSFLPAWHYSNDIGQLWQLSNISGNLHV